MAPQKMMVPASEVMSVTHRHSSSRSRGAAAPEMLSIRQEPGVFVPDGVPVVSLAPALGVPPPPDKGCPPVECVFPGVPVVFVTVVVGVEVPGVSVGCGAPVDTVGDSETVAVMGGVTTGVAVMVGVTIGVGVTGIAVGVITGVGGVVGVVVTCVGTTVGATGSVGVATGVFVTTGEGVGRRTGGFVPTGVGVGCR